MMYLTVESNGQRLKDSPSILLEDFTVLTGANGSGKTQLLNWLHQLQKQYYWQGEFFCRGEVKVEEVDIPFIDENGNFLLYITYVNPGFSLNPYEIDSNLQISSTQALMATIRQVWDGYDKVVKSSSFLKSVNHDNPIDEAVALNQAIVEFARTVIKEGGNSNGYTPITSEDILLARNLAATCGKDIRDLTFKDLLIFYDIPKDLFAPAIDVLFH